MASSPRPPTYIIGRKFGKLTAVSLRHIEKTNHPGRWVYKALCRCDCGKEKEILTSSLLRGYTTSCGCRREQYKTGEANANYAGFKKISGSVWKSIRREARRRNLSFEIGIEYLWNLFEKQNQKCKLSGQAIVLDTKIRTASLDRIVNTEGYLIGNVQWVHKIINLMKGQLDQDDFLSLCAAVTNTRNNIKISPVTLSASKLSENKVFGNREDATYINSDLNGILIGQRFGRYQIIDNPIIQHIPYYVRKVLCKCDCGIEKLIRVDSLLSGRTSSCGCLQYTGYKEIRGSKWNAYKRRAERRGIPFKLTLEYVWNLYIQQNKKCVLSGLPIIFGSSGKAENTSASIDRIDNNLGYIEGNVQIVDKRINMMRNVLSIQEFQNWCQAVVENVLV